MRITKIHIAAFGKLQNYDILFNEGFHLVYGENEYGKTTIMAFILMMFYGKPAGSRSGRDIMKNLRLRYLPWNGGKMGGSIEFVQGNDIYLVEKTWGKSEKSDRISIYKNGTESLQLPAGEDIGAHFFGMDAQAFENSIYVGNECVFAGNGANDSIAEKISNLSAAGDEAVSSEKIMKNLLAQKEEIISKSGRTGKLVKLREEIQSLQNECLRIETAVQEQRDIREKYRETAEKQRELQREKRQIEERIEFQRLEELINLEHSLTEEEKALEAYGAGASADEEIEAFIRESEILAEQAVKEPELSGQEPELSEEIPEQGRRLLEGVKEAKRKEALAAEQMKNTGGTEKKRENAPRASGEALYLSVGLALIFVGAGAGIGAKLGAKLLLNPFCLFAVAFGVCFLAFGARKRRERKKSLQGLAREKEEGEKNFRDAQNAAREAEKAFERFLEEYRVQTVEELQRRYVNQEKDKAIKMQANRLILEARGKLSEHFGKKEGEYREALRELSELKEKRERVLQLKRNISAAKRAYGYEDVSLDEMIERQIVCGGQPEEEGKNENGGMTALRERNRQIEQEMAKMNSDLRGFAEQIRAVAQNPETLRREIREKKELEKELDHRYQVADIAHSVMEETLNEIRQSFGPELNEKTSEILGKLTGGAYGETMVRKDYKVQVASGEDRHFREYGCFSAGTVEQVYLALRLAIVELVESESGKMPLFLDDVLAQYDDSRAKEAIRYLKEYAEGGQVIMFTCHGFIRELVQNIEE